MTTAHGSPHMDPQPKERLHRLIDELPDEDIDAVERYLQSLCTHDDPVLRAVRSAPVDDEPLTDEQREDIEKARNDLRAGNRVSDAQIRADLGL